MRVGLDVGSTTIKCVVLDDDDKIVYSTYERHYSHILEKSEELLRRMAQQYVPSGRALFAISGSAGMVNKIRELYPTSNITPIDYDPSATRVNQENRIKLMLAVGRERLESPPDAVEPERTDPERETVGV